MNAATPAGPERHTGPEDDPVGPTGEQPELELEDEEDEEYGPL